MREGLLAAVTDADQVSVDALSGLLSAAFDRAALDIDDGADAAEVRAALLWLLGKMLD
ncbi:MAG: hypothetical protein Q8L91_04770 [Polaromonas sp.]|nr:hypothetical protein [Polaromonas sp.]MDP3311339.1 hypothetical protein [Polaromonas sp.]